MKGFVMTCNWCGATVRLDNSESFPCEFCGHGTMFVQEGDDGPTLDAETRGTLTVADETELVAGWDEKNRQYRKLRPVRMRCLPVSKASDECCGRILYCKDATPFRCTACGHGMMREQKPTTHCCVCGLPIYGNVDPKRRVECSSCIKMGDEKMIQLDDLRTRKRILTPEEIKALYNRICAGGGWLDVRALEIATGKEFRGTAEFHRIMQEYFSRRLTGKPDRTLSNGVQIKRKRKALHLSQKQLGDLLGTAKITVVRWEQNKNEPSPKALAWLNAQIRPLERPSAQNSPYGEKVTWTYPPLPTL